MPAIDFSIDIHVHPTYKPMGHAFKEDEHTQSADPAEKTSLWYYNPPSPVDKILNFAGSLTKFSQCNLTACLYGKVWVLVVGLGSIEQRFFKNKLGTGLPGNFLDNFASGLTLPRIDAIEQMTDYFADIQNEIRFLKALNNVETDVDGNKVKYNIVKDFSELEAVCASNEKALNDASKKQGKTKKVITIALIFSVEGLHILNCGLNVPCDRDTVIRNARTLKSQEFRPWFVTFSHHFYNELCGQARSLAGVIAKLCDQSEGLNTGFTALGREVLDILLDESTGKPIFIDIKHLSPEGRKEYFEIRKQRDPGNNKIPVIISHGVCNGLQSHGGKASDNPLAKNFCADEINFYDDEILEMAKTNGVMGLQLDERRIANEKALKKTKNSVFRNKIMHYRSELLWNQIRYIAELLDKNGLPAWEHIAIGSDYDGIVDPINSFWTTEQYDSLKSFVERHAFEYAGGDIEKMKIEKNRNMKADAIVQNVFQNNAWEFFKRWY